MKRDDFMIVEYSLEYNNDIKELFYELQEYIMNIDKEKYNMISLEYSDDYFNKVMNEINDYNGKILLYKEENKIVGIIVGCINNEIINDYDFISPKRGRITEFVVKSEFCKKKIGQKLFDSMESYLKMQGCEAILIGVFAYNEYARNFYEKNGYHVRMTEMIKELN